jgi:hypothetical protein
MITELKNFYVEKGISALSFSGNCKVCEYFTMCSRNRDGSKKRPFITAKEAFISTGYETHKIPRILVLSLDPKQTDFYDVAEHRTIEEVRNHEEISSRESYYDWKPSSHWRKTYDCLFKLLGRFIKTRNINDIRHYFAHTNCAKCRDKPGNELSSEELFRNCSNFLPQEISILDPDVVITQGDIKKFWFMHEFKEKTDWDLFANFSILKKAHPIKLNDHNAIWIEMHHPCRRDSYYQLEDVANFNQYSELIHAYWSEYQIT